MPDHTILPAAVAAAAAGIPTADFVSIALVDDVGPWTVALAHPLARRLDGLQYMLSEGPIFDALSADEPVTCTDLDASAVWPEFAPRAVLNGVHAIMSVRLPTERGDGVLNVYCSRPGEFGAGTRSAAIAVAAELAVTLGSARRIANLTTALQSRDLIGQAKGIAMERYKISSDAAFALLSRISQERNVKLRDLAAEITTTGLVERPG
ncbi:GAF and ANTAR domain-containing protein [Actinocatenispora sera]|uniref:ANTAR domain-containing protein n=1 Tax=Actinocatenispora sera TaxID=390989 RepID=A0A810L820_9ACTN|nr:GAF and ANTAR domain-containing protein [Actinocatenispora sera]BCJ31684.1 hypothetical protein Asera_57920 [Actinocatenispora sera]